MFVVPPSGLQHNIEYLLSLSPILYAIIDAVISIHSFLVDALFISPLFSLYSLLRTCFTTQGVIVVAWTTYLPLYAMYQLTVHMINYPATTSNPLVAIHLTIVCLTLQSVTLKLVMLDDIHPPQLHYKQYIYLSI